MSIHIARKRHEIGNQDNDGARDGMDIAEKNMETLFEQRNNVELRTNDTTEISEEIEEDSDDGPVLLTDDLQPQPTSGSDQNGDGMLNMKTIALSNIGPDLLDNCNEEVVVEELPTEDQPDTQLGDANQIEQEISVEADTGKAFNWEVCDIRANGESGTQDDVEDETEVGTAPLSPKIVDDQGVGENFNTNDETTNSESTVTAVSYDTTNASEDDDIIVTEQEQEQKDNDGEVSNNELVGDVKLTSSMFQRDERIDETQIVLTTQELDTTHDQADKKHNNNNNDDDDNTDNDNNNDNDNSTEGSSDIAHANTPANDDTDNDNNNDNDKDITNNNTDINVNNDNDNNKEKNTDNNTDNTNDNTDTNINTDNNTNINVANNYDIESDNDTEINIDNSALSTNVDNSMQYTVVDAVSSPLAITEIDTDLSKHHTTPPDPQSTTPTSTTTTTPSTSTVTSTTTPTTTTTPTITTTPTATTTATTTPTTTTTLTTTTTPTTTTTSITSTTPTTTTPTFTTPITSASTPTTATATTTATTSATLDSNCDNDDLNSDTGHQVVNVNDVNDDDDGDDANDDDGNDDANDDDGNHDDVNNNDANNKGGDTTYLSSNTTATTNPLDKLATRLANLEATIDGDDITTTKRQDQQPPFLEQLQHQHKSSSSSLAENEDIKIDTSASREMPRTRVMFDEADDTMQVAKELRADIEKLTSKRKKKVPLKWNLAGLVQNSTKPIAPFVKPTDDNATHVGIDNHSTLVGNDENISPNKMSKIEGAKEGDAQDLKTPAPPSPVNHKDMTDSKHTPLPSPLPPTHKRRTLPNSKRPAQISPKREPKVWKPKGFDSRPLKPKDVWKPLEKVDVRSKTLTSRKTLDNRTFTSRKTLDNKSLTSRKTVDDSKQPWNRERLNRLAAPPGRMKKTEQDVTLLSVVKPKSFSPTKRLSWNPPPGWKHFDPTEYAKKRKRRIAAAKVKETPSPWQPLPKAVYKPNNNAEFV